MLDVMRSNAKSSLIVVIFGAIIISFVFSFGRGSSGFRTRTPETWAARVNGDLVTASDFTQAYASRFRQASAQRGGKYTTEQAQQDGLKKETLKSLVDQELIAQQASELGIVVSDAEVADAIAKSPQFQQEGKFDFEYYKRLVENGYGMSVPRFEDAYRRDLLRAKVIQAALSGANVSEDELRAFYEAQHEGAAISYVKFTGFMFREKATATDAEAEAWAKTHEKEIADQYEKDKKTRWTQGAAVKVRAVTVKLPPGAASKAGGDEETAARARIDAAYAEVKGGKDFAAVAKEKSDDIATKDQGGDLGFVSKGGSAYGKTLEDEALKLKPGSMSEVFKDRTGFHFLKVEEERAAKEQPLAEVKKQIAEDLFKGEKAKQLAREKAVETLAQVKAGKDIKDLFPAKKADAGQFDFSSFMTPQSADTEVFHPQGGFIPGIGAAPRLSEAVFAQTSAGATPAAPVEDGDTWYVFKVKSRERADLSKFDEAEKKTARERLEGQKQGELYSQWIERLRKGATVVENDSVLSYESGAGQQNYNPDDY
jgi:peptidyl-prolyl cis-trans isomerase D